MPVVDPKGALRAAAAIWLPSGRSLYSDA